VEVRSRWLKSGRSQRRPSRRIPAFGWSRRRRSRLGSLRMRVGRPFPAVSGLSGGFVLAYFLDPARGRRRRKLVIQRAGGLVRRTSRKGRRAARHAASQATGRAQRAVHPRARQAPPGDDVTLAHKVETEIFRPADAPKAAVNVNAVDGVVFLRGVARTAAEIAELEREVRAIPGVREVENLLHLPGTPAPPAPAARAGSGARRHRTRR
jgi:BON domain-containing protein